VHIPRRFIPMATLAMAVTLAAALTAIGPPGTAPAHASATPAIKVVNGQTQPVFSYTNAIRQYVMVQSPVDSDHDGKKDLIRVDIIRPKESDSGLKVPVIMDESPYYDNLGRGNESQRKKYDSHGNPIDFPLYYDNYFVPRGYAVLEVDMDGTTKSQGCPTSGGRSDVLGGKAVIDWLNGRAKAYNPDGTAAKAYWTNGKAAMIGKSYDATLADAVAATGVQGLTTIVPIAGITSWYDYSRMNGVLNFSGEEDGLAETVAPTRGTACAAVFSQLAAGEDDTNVNYNAFWNERNYRTGPVADASLVHASVFAVQGLNDLNVKPSQFNAFWKSLAARGVPRKLWLSQYGHVDPFDYRRATWVNTLHQWFDSWLQGIKNGVMGQPRVDLETAPDVWTTQSDWPARGARNVALRPQPNGTLGLRPAAGAGTGVYTDTTQSEATMVTDPTTGEPYRLAYATPPLSRALTVSGTPTVDLRVKLNGPTARLSALLVDYGTDTRVDYLGDGEGITTLATRDCWGESTAADSACYLKTQTATVTSAVNVVARGYLDAAHATSLSHPTPLTTGRYYRLSWQTMPQDYVFKAGHRLALVLAGADSDSSDTPRPTGAQVTVDLAGSQIVLPVLISGGTTDLTQPQTPWRGPANVVLPRQPNKFN
jgi:predicted acyl esterase